MASFNDKWVLCPFYQRDDSNGIICEGIVKESALRNMFQLPNGAKKIEAKNEYMSEFCMGNYRKCKIAKMLYDKYAEEQVRK